VLREFHESSKMGGFPVIDHEIVVGWGTQECDGSVCIWSTVESSVTV
jgi:hypothetical protein